MRVELPSLRSLALAALLAGTVAAPAQAQMSEGMCGSLSASFGPFDYRPEFFKPAHGDQQSHAEKRNLVESAHFTAAVEAGTGGNTAKLPGPDMEYTLRVFPNHHRALAALIRVWERAGKMPTPPSYRLPAECYFERALRFRPDDTIVRLLYATFLVKSRRNGDAAATLDAAAGMAGDKGITHHNIGLVYLDAGVPKKALEQAHRALALGFQGEELRRRLVAAGQWAEPTVPSAPVAASEPAAPGSAAQAGASSPQ